MKRFLPLMLLLFALAGPTLAQPAEERPSRDDEREQMRERMRQRAEERRGEGEQPGPGADGRGERGERGGDGRPDRPGIRPEDIEVALEVLAEFSAERAQELRELAKDDPQAAAEKIARVYPRIQEMVELKREDPRRFELHLQSMRTMKQLWPLRRQIIDAKREGNEQRVAELTPQYREHVAQMFEIRLELRRLEIEKLRAEVQKLEDEIEDLDTNRQEHIEAAMDRELDPERDHWRGRRERDDDRRGEDEPRD